MPLITRKTAAGEKCVSCNQVLGQSKKLQINTNNSAEFLPGNHNLNPDTLKKNKYEPSKNKIITEVSEVILPEINENKKKNVCINKSTSKTPINEIGGMATHDANSSLNNSNERIENDNEVEPGDAENKDESQNEPNMNESELVGIKSKGVNLNDKDNKNSTGLKKKTNSNKNLTGVKNASKTVRNKTPTKITFNDEDKYNNSINAELEKSVVNPEKLLRAANKLFEGLEKKITK